MKTFTEKARQVADPYWQGSFEHLFVRQLAEGTLAPTVFRYYLLQDRYYLEHFGRIYQLIAEKTTDEAVREQMLANSQGMAAGELAIRQGFFTELEITPEEIATTPIAPTAYHYVSHMYRQLAEGTVATACAGVLPCPWLYQEIGDRLIASGSPNPLYQRWIATYAGEEGQQEVMRQRQLLDRLYEEVAADEQEQMLAAFYISSQLEYQFWEMALTLETWPAGAIGGMINGINRREIGI